MKFAPIKIAEFLVPGQHIGELTLLFVSIARQQHPQILNRRPRACIVEIDKKRPIVPQDVPAVTIAVQAQCPHSAGTRKTLPYQFQRLIGNPEVNLGQFAGQSAAHGEEVARILPKRLNSQRGAMLKALESAYGMNPPEKSPHPLADVRAIQLGGTSSLSRKHGKTQIFVKVERFSAQ